MSSSNVSLSGYENSCSNMYTRHAPSTTKPKVQGPSPSHLHHSGLPKMHDGRSQHISLTIEVIAHHNHHSFRTIQADVPPTDYLNTDVSLPYKRYCSYEPLIDVGIEAFETRTNRHRQVVNTPSNNTSYASTPSYDATPSYNSTLPVVYNSTPASVQSNFDLEPYVYTHTHWCSEEHELAERRCYDVAHIGAQFDMYAQVQFMKTGKI